jgi:hypothetical protein
MRQIPSIFLSHFSILLYFYPSIDPSIHRSIVCVCVAAHSRILCNIRQERINNIGVYHLNIWIFEYLNICSADLSICPAPLRLSTPAPLLYCSAPLLLYSAALLLCSSTPLLCSTAPLLLLYSTAPLLCCSYTPCSYIIDVEIKGKTSAHLLLHSYIYAV